ncbi:hypothetical protein Hanom_Chr13g01213761 [Helianthus anomalus]
MALLPWPEEIRNPHALNGHHIAKNILLPRLTPLKCLNQLLQPIKSLLHVARE